MKKTLVILSIGIIAIGVFISIIFADSPVTIDDFFLVVKINGNTPEKLKTVYIKKGDSLEIYPVFKANNTLYSSTAQFVERGQKYLTKRIPAEFSFKWTQISPVLKEYDNLKFDDPELVNTYIDPITYNSKPLTDISNYKSGISFDQFSEVFGTYYISLKSKDFINKSPLNSDRLTETEPINEVYPYKVVQIVYREDDTYLGYLKELFHTPFIMAPRRTLEGFHEVDSHVGSDCAALAIYGKRREGYNYYYLGPMGIYKYLTPIVEGDLYPKKDMEGLYYTRNLENIKVGKTGIGPGDIVHFGYQVSVFYQDEGIKGYLDKNDLLIQSYIPSPSITTIENSGFYHLPIRIFKWKDLREIN